MNNTDKIIANSIVSAEAALERAGKSADQADVTYCTGILDALLELQEKLSTNPTQPE
tara:strand:+ start:5059 stop:5229 length:171 start_codon:yes stop_codon:yes gene_type:complete